MRRASLREWVAVGSVTDRQEAAKAQRWLAERVGLLPARWAAHVGAEHARRGGLRTAAANLWLLEVTEPGAARRVPLSATDDDLRAAAVEAAREAAGIVASALPADAVGKARLLARLCAAFGVTMPGDKAAGALPLPGVARLCCRRWWLRRLRRAHGQAAEGAGIAGGVVRRGLWPYASQDAVERRTAQRKRNARALDKAVVACEESGEALPLAEVVAGSLANPEVKRSELMVRVRGCDAIAHDEGAACEFWTLTAPSRFHAQRISGATAEPNKAYDGSTPREAQAYIRSVWARARAAWKRVGLEIFGLRTAEPHHDGCPHWHLIAYGRADDLRIARWILKRHALRDSGGEPGAREHRFSWLAAKGAKGASYAAKYIAKNIDGAGMEGARDGETGRKVSATVVRVDAWASTWGIRQFQFFGCPQVSIWRALRKLRGPVAVVGSMLERARSAADDSDFAEFWRCCKRGGLKLIYRAADRLTAYGDAAAARVAGVREGARRALLPVKTWVIHWAGVAKGAAGLGFDLPWSGVNNCTRRGPDDLEEAVAAIFA